MSNVTRLLRIVAVVAGLTVGQPVQPKTQRAAPISEARGSSASEPELPAPTGQYGIGAKIYNWVDHSRHELASKDPAESRQVIVQVWYPAGDQSGPVAPYVPMLSSYRHVWPESQVDLARRTLTHSRLNAKPKPGMRFAVVLLSHGWEGTRSEYTSVAEDLASHGYAVFGVDHPYMGRIALPNGEVTEPTERQFHSPAEIVAYYACDLEFVIARIGEMNREDPDQLFVGKFDLTRIAAIGHSSGFVAASGACKADSRIQACVNIDAPGFSANDLAGLEQPLLWIRLEKAGNVPAEYLKNTRATVYELQIQAANHGSVEDWEYLEAASPPQRVQADKLLETIREFVEAFLSKYFYHQDSGLIDPGYSQPGIQLKVYTPTPNQRFRRAP